MDLLILLNDKKERSDVADIIATHHPDFNMILSSFSGYEDFFFQTMMKPDIVITDIDQDHRKGISIIDHLYDKNANISILLLTKNNTIDFIKVAMKHHIHEVLSNPISTNSLLVTLKECIELHHRRKAEINEYLNHRFATLKTHIDQTLLYQIVVNGDIKELMHLLEFYDFEFKDAVLAVMSSDATKRQIHSFIALMNTLDLQIIHAQLANKYIFLILSKIKISIPFAEKIRNVIHQTNATQFVLGIGFVKQNIRDLHHSYLEALDEIIEGRGKKQLLHTQLLDPTRTFSIKMFYAKLYKHYLFSEMSEIEVSLEKAIIAMQGLEDDEINSYIQEFLSLHEQFIRKQHPEYRLPPIAAIQVNRTNPYTSLKLQLLDFYDQIMTPLPIDRNRKSLQLVQKAVRYIYQNYKKTITLEGIAAHLHVSDSYICRIFVEHTSISLIDYLNLVRINEAKKILISDKSVKDVALETGFRSTTYFGRVFKKYVQLTPNEYKKLFCHANNAST